MLLINSIIRKLIICFSGTILFFFCSRGHEQVLLQLNKIKEELGELKTSSQNLRIKMDEMESRLLLLEDEMETRKLASLRKKNLNDLPVVKLKPPTEDIKEDGINEKNDFYTLEFKQIDENGNIVSYNNNSFSSEDINELAMGESLSVTKPPSKNEKMSEEHKILNEYKKAYELYQKGALEEAIKLFENFLRLYPFHSYADNSLYWIGECYYALKEFKRAKEVFLRIIEEYPSENKVPDAMLKIALCDENLEDYSSAKEMYTKVILFYPQTKPAMIAMRKIQEIKKEK